jgi:hypothetical protein
VSGRAHISTALLPRETSGHDLIECGVGHRASLGVSQTKKMFCLCRKSKIGKSVKLVVNIFFKFYFILFIYLFIFAIGQTQLYRPCMFGFYSILLHVSAVHISHFNVRHCYTERIKSDLPLYSFCVSMPYLKMADVDSRNT